MSSAEAVIDSAEVESKKRPRGRPKKESPAHATIITDVPNPARLKFYSDSASPNQRTAAGLKWWNELSDPCKELIDVTIYRDWPALNDPTEEGDYKYIDKLLGTQPLKNDQDFIDRWGAGDYHAYVNVTPLGGTRRTVMMLFIKGSHDFKTYLPTDQRIDNPVEHLSLADPGNASYVAWLRSTGKIKDDAKTAKEAEDMAAGNAVMAEIVKDALADRREMTQKLLERNEQDAVIPPEPPPSPQEVISDQLAIFKSLKELVPTSDPMEMMKQVVATAQLLVQKDGTSDLKPLMEEITKLRQESRDTEREMWRTQLADIKEQLKAKDNTGPNVLLPDGSNISAMIEKAVEKFIDTKPEPSPWLDIAKMALPVVGPALNAFAARLMAPAPQPQAAPFPMPPGSPQQQAQLPAPQQAAPQSNGAYTTGNPQLDQLLMMIQIPLADHLRDGLTGIDFAEEFVENFGLDLHTNLAATGTDTITGILYAYPPLVPVLKPLAREKVTRFVTEFVNYKPTEVTAGGAA